jgi:hypothetical protein
MATENSFQAMMRFQVEGDNADGAITEKILDTAVELAPPGVSGIVAGADLVKNEVHLVCTVEGVTDAAHAEAVIDDFAASIVAAQDETSGKAAAALELVPA